MNFLKKIFLTVTGSSIETSKQKANEYKTSSPLEDEIIAHSPLHIAIEEKNKENVKLIIAGGADLNVKNKYGMTPLHLAVFNGSKEITEILIEKGANINAKIGEFREYRNLFNEMNKGNKEAWKLSEDIKRRYSMTPLHLAVLKGHKEIAEFLITKKADVNARTEDYREETPLHTAIMGGKKELAELLISSGAGVNIKDKSGNSPLHLAVIKGHREITELLIANGADVNGKTGDLLGFSPLYMADTKELVELLISKGADVNGTNTIYGSTPLHKPPKSAEIMEILISHGADVNKKDKYGCPPLHRADTKKKLELLLSKGADINLKDNEGNPLIHHVACYICDSNVNEKMEMIKFLVSKGIDINGRDGKRITVLTKVIEEEDKAWEHGGPAYGRIAEKIKNLLLSYGAHK